MLSQHDRWIQAQEKIAELDRRNAVLVAQSSELENKLEQSQKELQESKLTIAQLQQKLEQGRKGFSESQKEVHKLKAKISQQAADVARYQRRIEKLRELLAKAGGLLERALTSSRWRLGSLVLFRSRKFAGESDPRWRKRLLGEFKAWVQQGGEYSTAHAAKDQSYAQRPG